VGERGLAAHPFGVLAGGGQQLAGVVVADRQQPQQPWRGLGDQLGQPMVSQGDLGLAGRAQQPHPVGSQGAFELGAVVVLVADQHLPGRAATSAGSMASRSSSTWRSSALAPVSANATGRPCRVQTRCNRRPQNQREWLAHQP
jgi:hypothetical protein